MNWVKVGTNVAVGGAAGAVGEFIRDKDAERDPKPKWYEEYGTYYNYGIPIAAILLAAFGMIRGDWETRLITAGATLAGSKGYKQIKAAGAPAGYKRRWTRDDELRRQREEAARRARERGGGGGPRETIAEI